MRKATTLLCMLLFAGTAFGQQVDYALELEASDDINAGYRVNVQSGARDIAGPYDLDGDGLMEVLAADYTGGGRVHVIENKGVDTWELVYSTPVLDSTGTSNNIRAITGGDLDGDGMGEIYFLAGRGYSATNPNIDTYVPGLYVFEAMGDDDFGTAPTSIYEFSGDLPDRWRAEDMIAMDVDGDGLDEVMFGNNGSDNRYDNWYVIGVTGDIGTGFEVFVEEVRLSSRGTEDFDPVGRGGGSPYGMVPVDLDGDGGYEIVMHSWNAYNFTNAQAIGENLYEAPTETSENIFLQASAPDDHVAFFGCVMADIDQNGDGEVVCPNLQTGDASVINYEAGEDVLQITMDNIGLGIIDGLSTLGIGAGDLDGDGQMELFGTGPGYSDVNAFNTSSPAWVSVAEYMGGDVEDPASYSAVQDLVSNEAPYTAFHTLITMAGQDSTIDNFINATDPLDVTIGGSDPEFASKFAYLGDVDGDGSNELAFGIQGVKDTLYTIREVAADSFIVENAVINENRTFLRIVSGSGTGVNVEEDKIVLPSDYRLEGNYPNPFNPSTTIRFTLPIDKQISVRVYDVAGRLVKTLIDGQRYTQGTHQVTWDGTNQGGAQVASGTYVYSLEYGNFRQSQTMVLVK